MAKNLSKSTIVKKWAKKKGLKVKNLKASKMKPEDFLGQATFIEKTRLQMLMDQEHEINNCQKCKTRIITVKGSTSHCQMCGSADILKEFWV